MENPSTNCRRCGSLIWHVITTTKCSLDAETKKIKKEPWISKHFRCSNCGTKALVEQDALLEALSQEAEEVTELPGPSTLLQQTSYSAQDSGAIITSPATESLEELASKVKKRTKGNS